MIKAQQIFKSYGEVKVLKGVNLEVEAGKLAAIVGKSGSGKSTLLHILGSLDKPDKGIVNINGVSLFDQKESKLAELRNREIGFIFQFHHLLGEFTALENVAIPYYIANRSKSDAEKRAKELLDYMQLSHRIDHKPNQLSGGEQQRVAVARALMMQPSVILADEPTGNLDSKTSEDLLKIFRQLNNDFNQTIIMVTHNLDLASQCDLTLMMQDGQLIQ